MMHYSIEYILWHIYIYIAIALWNLTSWWGGMIQNFLFASPSYFNSLEYFQIFIGVIIKKPMISYVPIDDCTNPYELHNAPTSTYRSEVIYDE